jgi:hypothetical protein
MDDPLGYYAALDLSPRAFDRDIRESFNRVSKALHPDKQPEVMKAAAASTFVRLRRLKKCCLTLPSGTLMTSLEGVTLLSTHS